MSNMEQLVSIIIPVYNREHLIVGALKSVLTQSYTQWECLIVDDFSTDNTWGVVQEFIKREDRFKLIPNRRKKGAQGARNTGIMSASGKYLVFLDSDDLLTEESVKSRVDYYKRTGPQTGLVYGDLRSGAHFKTNGYARKLIIRNLCLCPFSVMLIPKSVFETIGLLDETLPSWQDDDLVISISKHYEIHHCSSEVACWNLLDKTDSIGMNLKRVEDGLKLLLKKHKNDIISEVGLTYHFLWKARLLRLRLKRANKNLCNRLLLRGIDVVLRNKFDIVYF